MNVLDMKSQISLVAKGRGAQVAREFFDAHVNDFDVRIQIFFLRKRPLTLEARVSSSVHSFVSHHGAFVQKTF